MNLSFTIHNWPGMDWEQFCAAAADARLQGVEMDTVDNPIFQTRMSPTNPELAVAAHRQLVGQNLTIPCIGTEADLMAPEAGAAVAAAVETAKNLLVPYVVLRTDSTDVGAVARRLGPLVEEAEDAGVVLLLETVGAMADTGLLREILDAFASDHLAACWSMFDTCLMAGETAERTITNLGAYVRHVRITDGMETDGTWSHELVGEGHLPLVDLMNALRSVNYDGFLSLRWEPAWVPGLDDLEMLLTHYAVFMGGFENPRRKKKHLYRNKTGTGKFVWKKESLIEKTFSRCWTPWRRSSRTSRPSATPPWTTPAPTASSGRMWTSAPGRSSPPG